MPRFDTLVRNALVVDGSGAAGFAADVLLQDDRIVGVESAASTSSSSAANTIEADGLVLSPGFIDTHTHDDMSIVRKPAMRPKLTQGVTTVVVGNCGISAAPVTLRGELPDPMNLLGAATDFAYPNFADYVTAVEQATPAVNVAALVGHTALRSNHMDQLERSATPAEIAAMRGQLQEAMRCGALGLSTGLAYGSARHASTEEVLALADVLTSMNGLYTTHLRSEADAILPAIDEALQIGRVRGVPVVISHLKCTGVVNWGRSAEVLAVLDHVPPGDVQVAWDCYPYAASSSTLDLGQVDPRVRITITWSEPHPEQAGRTLEEIAASWSLPQREAAQRLQPAGAIYFGMDEADVRRILQHPRSMIGSDGLPNDPRPHPRLWGTFPRVLGPLCREQKLFPLPEAVRRMTGLPASVFGLHDRGLVRAGYAADLVLFDPETIEDTATFSHPERLARGLHCVWVNGVLSYESGDANGRRAGRFLRRREQRTSGGEERSE